MTPVGFGFELLARLVSVFVLFRAKAPGCGRFLYLTPMIKIKKGLWMAVL